jgi:hypothetical protein
MFFVVCVLYARVPNVDNHVRKGITLLGSVDIT